MNRLKPSSQKPSWAIRSIQPAAERQPGGREPAPGHLRLETLRRDHNVLRTRTLIVLSTLIDRLLQEALEPASIGAIASEQAERGTV